MSHAYYNELDPKAAAWLRELIARGLIAAGDVDERSIEDVVPNDLRGYTQCHFFAGIGGWSLALRIAGWPDSRPVWTGSCPCQPFSAAGKGAGFADERHLWPAWFHLIAQRRPPRVFGEQVASAAGHGWIDLVQADLEGQGYAVGHHVLGAHSVGAPHQRQRTWFVADAECHDHRCETAAADHRHPQTDRSADRIGGRRGSLDRLADADGGHACTEGLQRGRQHGQQSQDDGAVQLGDTSGEGLPLGSLSADGSRIVRIEGTAVGEAEPLRGFWSGADWIACRDGKWRPVEPGTFPLADGLPARVVRLRGYGNAIVPEVAAAFIQAAIECGIGHELVEVAEAA